MLSSIKKISWNMTFLTLALVFPTCGHAATPSPQTLITYCQGFADEITTNTEFEYETWEVDIAAREVSGFATYHGWIGGVKRLEFVCVYDNQGIRLSYAVREDGSKWITFPREKTGRGFF